MIMDRTKSRVNTVVDRSALAKSAAWAWLQHGSNGSSDGQSEFDALRTKIQPKPSRYKLEAFKLEQKYLTPNSPTIKLGTPTRPSSNKPLLDNYEIDRISKQLQYYVESSSAARDSGGGTAAEAVAVATNKDKVVQKKIKIPKGFWRMRHVPACGSSIDDVVGNIRGVEYSRQPDKGRGRPLNVIRP